jgi:hypothetical protein
VFDQAFCLESDRVSDPVFYWGSCPVFDPASAMEFYFLNRTVSEKMMAVTARMKFGLESSGSRPQNV